MKARAAALSMISSDMSTNKRSRRIITPRRPRRKSASAVRRSTEVGTAAISAIGRLRSAPRRRGQVEGAHQAGHQQQGGEFDGDQVVAVEAEAYLLGRHDYALRGRAAGGE